MKRKIYLALCIVLGLVFVGSSVGVGVTLYGYQKADRTYRELQTRYVHETAEMPEDEPLLAERAPIRVDFEALGQENSDVIGWLYCADTVVNYPVVQSSDNEDYLHRDLHGQYLVSGTLFADCRCSAVGTDQNHIIYGHNMKNGTMFGTLVKYKEQSYYDAHPVLYYLTLEQDYKIELFAGFVTEADSDIYRPEIGGAEEFAAFLQSLQARSTFVSDVSVTGEDQIVTLSTCSYEFGNARYVVFGKMICLSDPD